MRPVSDDKPLWQCIGYQRGLSLKNPPALTRAHNQRSVPFRANGVRLLTEVILVALPTPPQAAPLARGRNPCCATSSYVQTACHPQRARSSNGDGKLGDGKVGDGIHLRCRCGRWQPRASTCLQQKSEGGPLIRILRDTCRTGQRHPARNLPKPGASSVSMPRTITHTQ